MHPERAALEAEVLDVETVGAEGGGGLVEGAGGRCGGEAVEFELAGLWRGWRLWLGLRFGLGRRRLFEQGMEAGQVHAGLAG